MFDLTGKVALVTGSSQGLGAAIARCMADAGADVVINYVSESSKKKAEKVADYARGTCYSSRCQQRGSSICDDGCDPPEIWPLGHSGQ